MTMKKDSSEKKTNMLKRLLSPRLWRKITSVLLVVVVFVTTYMMILPAISIDIDTVIEEPGMEVAYSNVGDGQMVMAGESLTDGSNELADISESIAENPEESAEGLVPNNGESFSFDSTGSIPSDLNEIIPDEETDILDEEISDLAIHELSDSSDILAEEFIPSDDLGDEISEASLELLEDEKETLPSEDRNIIEDATDPTELLDSKSENDEETALTHILKAEGTDYSITLSYTDDAEIPKDAELLVTEILSDEYGYDQYVNKAADALSTEERIMSVDNARFFDITIVDNGIPVEPKVPVTVLVELADSFAADDDASVIHYTDDEVKVVETVDFKENAENMEVNAELHTVSEATADLESGMEASATAASAEGSIAFVADSFSVYGFVSATIEKTILASDGYNYKVTVSFGPETGIPENAELTVEEILPGDSNGENTASAYKGYVSKTENILGMEKESVSYIRLFDISIVDKNDHNVQYQPAAGTLVAVRIELADRDGGQFNLVHFSDETDRGSVVNIESDGQVLSFAAEGFSVYAIVGTDENAHQVRVKYVFQDAEGSPFLFFDEAGELVDNQIIKNGESLESVGLPELDADDQTFNGWYIYDTVNNSFTGYQITFDKPIAISASAEVTTVTGDRVEISNADNAAASDPANPDYTVYVRPFCGEVRYITFWNEVDGNIVYTKIQVPKDAEYNIASQKAIPPDAIVNDDGEVEYVSYAFEGWATEPGTLERPGHQDNRTAVSNTVITVSEDCEFYPIYRLAHWISFNTAPTGSGATYYAPVYVKSGESAAGAKPAGTPVWPGHTFVGWFEEEDDDYLSVGETANGTFNFNQVIDEDKVLYAHWNAGTANVTIIRWLQAVTDSKDYTNAQKTYEYGGQENIIRDVNTVVYANAFNDVNGFSINSAKSDRSVIVKEDGTAELNIYYDRKTIQMIFAGLGNQPGTYYSETTSTSGTQYGLVDGSYVQLTRGTIPVTTWSYRAFNNAGTNTTNNVYGLVNGEYVRITRSNTRNVYNGETYTGTRYSTTTGSNTNPQQYGVRNGQVEPIYHHYRRYLYDHWSFNQDHSVFFDEQYNGTRYIINNNGDYGFGSVGMQQLDYSWTVNEDGSLYTGPRYVQTTSNTNYDGNRYIRTGSSYNNYEYARTDSTTGTQYGTDVRGGHVQLTPTTTNQEVWYYVDINGETHIYEDTRYSKTTENNTTVYTGLYGQTLEQNGYVWPQGVWQYSGGGMSYLGQFVLPNDISGNTIRFNSNGTAGKRFYYFLQNVDGTYNTVYTDIGYGTSNVGTFNFTEKYDGFTVDSYQRGNTGNGTTGSWTSTSNGSSVSMSGQTSLGVRYRRLAYDIKFLDSRNGTELSDIQAKTLVYGANLSNADPAVTTLTPPTPQYVWDGHWYTDQECTEIALFHNDLTTEGELGDYTSIDTINRTVTYGTGTNAKTYHYQVLGTMPNHDIAVYAGWNEIWYWVKIDPDGGTLTDTESTWFWKTLGEKIEEYHDVTRRYVEDPEGPWYYHYDELDPETELNQYGTNERKAYYTLNPALSSDGGKTYSVDNKAYSLVGWYEVDQETGRLKGLYNFDGGVTGNTILRAVWRTVGEYTVRYSTEAVDASGNPLYSDAEDEETRIDTGDGTAPVDSSVYADKSNSAIARAPSSNPEDYVFMGWYYDGRTYGPGDAFMIKAELANADKEIWLYPVYVKYDDLPVTVTHIHWYANYNDRLGNQINDRTENNQPSDDTTNDPLQLNAAVDIMDIDDLLDGSTAYAGYKFLGWAKTQGANEPWLKIENDGTYSMKDGTKTVTDITMVAADEILPYDDMYAVWEPRPYTVTVVKTVDSILSSDKHYPFTFTPDFNASGLPAEYQNNFSLTGEETIVSPEDGVGVTYHTQKIFENVPYGSTFSFTEANYEDFELQNVKYTVTDAEDTSKNVTDRISANGESITVYGNVTVTFTNKPRHKTVRIYKVDDSETPEALDSVGFTLGENSLTTGSDGYTETIVLQNGEYQLEETEPKEHYIGLNKPVTVSVGSAGVTVPTGTENVTVSGPDSDGIYTITVINVKTASITAEKVWFASQDSNKAPVVVQLLRDYEGLQTPEVVRTFTLSGDDTTPWKKTFDDLPMSVSVNGIRKPYRYYLNELGLNLGDESAPVPLADYDLEAKYYASADNRMTSNGWNGMNGNNKQFTLSSEGTLYVGNRPLTEGTQMDVRKKWKGFGDAYAWADIGDRADVKELRITLKLFRTATYSTGGTPTEKTDELGDIQVGIENNATKIFSNTTGIYAVPDELWHITIPESNNQDGMRQLPLRGLYYDGTAYHNADFRYFIRETQIMNGETDVTEEWDSGSDVTDSGRQVYLFNYEKYDLTVVKKWIVNDLSLISAVKAIYFKVEQSLSSGTKTDIGQLIYTAPELYGLTADQVAQITLDGTTYYVVKMIPDGVNGAWSAEQSVLIKNLCASRNSYQGMNSGNQNDHWPEVLYTVTELAYEDAENTVKAMPALCIPQYENKVRNGEYQNKGGPEPLQLGLDGESSVRVTNVLAYDVDILKTDDAERPLPGAQFTLYGQDYYLSDGTTVNTEAQPITGKTNLISGTNGIIALGKLDKGTYYLLETQAPPGYIRLSKPVKIVVDSTSIFNKQVAEGDVTVIYPLFVTYEYYLESGNQANLSITHEGIAVQVNEGEGEALYSYILTVPNSAGAVLPSTGGPGTDRIYLLGIMLTAFAGAGLLMRKKRGDAE